MMLQLLQNQLKATQLLQNVLLRHVIHLLIEINKGS